MSSKIKHFFKRTHERIREISGKVARLKEEKDEADRVKYSQEKTKEKSQVLEIKVSGATIAKFVLITIALLLLMGFFYQIRDIVLIFFVSLLFAAALDPMVDALQRRKIPRPLGVIIIYLVILILLGLLISNIVPVIASEVSQLASKIQDFVSNMIRGEIKIPDFLETFKPTIKQWFEAVDISMLSNYREFLMQAANRLSDVAGNVFNAVIVLFNGVFNTILVLVLTFMMTVDEEGIDKFILSLFPAKYGQYITEKSKMVKAKIGYWLRGQITLCIVVGVLVYIGFLIIGLLTQKVEYATTIAIVAGFTELIPYIGPFIAWLLALPIVANQSLMLIVWMTVLMYAVQLLENNLIVPLVMKKAVGISPIFVIFAMMVGFSFLGILGMVLAVPVATTVAIFIRDYANKEK